VQETPARAESRPESTPGVDRTPVGDSEEEEPHPAKSAGKHARNHAHLRNAIRRIGIYCLPGANEHERADPRW
jgi:hypothetical protein